MAHSERLKRRQYTNTVVSKYWTPHFIALTYSLLIQVMLRLNFWEILLR